MPRPALVTPPAASRPTKKPAVFTAGFLFMNRYRPFGSALRPA